MSIPGRRMRMINRAPHTPAQNTNGFTGTSKPPSPQTTNVYPAMKPYALTLLLLCVVIGCNSTDGMDENEHTDPSPSAHLNPDVAPVTQGTWYRPQPDVTWQWQLQGTINTSFDAEIYDVDLFETPEAVIQSLHDRGRKVICYFSAGSGENYRPDYPNFADSDLGRKLDGYDNERWLDIRSQTVIDVMEARLDLAVQRGCDGVEPDNVTAYNNDTGFDLSARDQLAFNRHLANEAHRRGLSIALKNDGDQAAELVDYFDFELNEECHQYEECDQLAPFRQQGKPILNAEYTDSRSEAESMRASLCARAAAAGTQTLILHVDLDDTFRVACF